MSARLSLRTLPGVPAGLRPAFDLAGLGVGVVHLGIGAFHRAHQAVYTDQAVADAGGDWGICGVSQRSRTVPDQLGPQDGLFTVLERSADGVDGRVVGCVRRVLLASESHAELVDRLADPATKVVTLTVTEKAYRHDPATGRLNAADPEVVADLDGRPAVTVVGQIAQGLRARRAADAGPLTVLSCDNLPANGRLLAGVVGEYCQRLDGRAGDGLAAWVAEQVTFPSSMVDRIVPATTADDLAEVRRLLGVEDLGAVVAEPFRQWVIEDRFAAGRPAWDRAGAILTGDVAPYEAMKLRLLNGAHSTLAYLGALAGHRYIWQAVGDPRLAAAARRLMDDDATPTLAAPAGVDLAAYKDQVLDRFANPALGHRTHQVAMDGSQKLPQRLLDSARARLAAGAEPTWVCLSVAGWMRYLAGRADDGSGFEVDDPLADRLTPLADGDPATVVDRLLGVEAVFGQDLPASAVFRQRVVDWLAQLAGGGVAATLRGV